MKWTDDQLRAIRTTGGNLLVSAAAGSGKTAVLAERCAHLVCDALDKCDVDQLLVVTFTNAAATEMRGRIEQALRQRLESAADSRLSRQLLLIGRAQIDTLHAFCTHVLRRHFHVLGLDPNFRVLDGEEVMLLKHDIARAVLDDRYDSGDPEFQRLVDNYADGYDPRILSQMLHLHDLMQSVVDPGAWLSDCTARIAEACSAKPLSKSTMGREMVDLVQRWLADLRGQWVGLAKTISEIKGLEPYGEYVNDLLAAVEHWKDVFARGNFDALAHEVKDFNPPRLKPIKNPPPEKEAIQAQLSTVRDEMRKSAMAAACQFTEQEWRDALHATYEPMRLLIDLEREFSRRFGRAKRDLRSLDFSDLERFTLRVLCENEIDLSPSPIAELYRRQFKHVLVDEYQDINPVQDAILGLLSGDNNLFCVGDVKQSIYRFRLAQPKQFLQRLTIWRATAASSTGKREGSVIDLAANFRSRGPLLDVVNGVFQRLMTEDAVEIEYDESHRLRAGATYPPDVKDSSFPGAPVEMHILPPPPKDPEDHSPDADADLDRSEREAVFVAHRIRELMGRGMQVADKSADGSLALRPLRYGDIVVLLRSMRYKSQSFALGLRAAGIPVHTDSATGFFDSTEVRDMLALLRVLDNQRQDIPLAAFLRSPLAGVEDSEDALARIHLKYPDRPFHLAAVTYAAKQNDDLSRSLERLFARLKEWRRIAHQRPVAELVWQIYDETGYLAFVSGLEQGTQRSANLIEFHERARQFGTFQRQGLGRFMQFLHSLAEHTDLGQASIASEADDVVRIMTIHRAKGLEFPVVIVPDLGKQHNLLDTRGPMLVDREAGIGLLAVDPKKRVRYPSLSHVLVQDRIRRQTLAEEMRVLYVAMTRAREHLILVGTCDASMPQQWRDEWMGHNGPIPPERVLAARTMLDWLGPAAAALTRKNDEPIVVTIHGEAEFQSWSASPARTAAVPAESEILARLSPLNPPPTMHPRAQALIDRLTRAYPHEPFTSVGAAISVGAATKGTALDRERDNGWHDPVPSIDFDLRPPRCVSEDATPPATEIGTATHLVLEHLDFSRKCDREDVQLQIADLVRRKLLRQSLAAVVDTEAILWLISTPLGQTLRKNSGRLLRELPIYAPIVSTDAPPPDDPFDRVMLRGRLDLMINDPAGAIIVDYKTDSVNVETVDARAGVYRPQVRAYRQVIEGITNVPVKSAFLVFLSPRLLREVT